MWVSSCLTEINLAKYLGTIVDSIRQANINSNNVHSFLYLNLFRVKNKLISDWLLCFGLERN